MNLRNTLADMLATSDTSFNGITFEEGLSKRFESNVGQPELPEPIGISSRDGWKGTSRRNLSKSRNIMNEDRTCGYKIVLPKKLITLDGLVKGSYFHNREFILSNNSHFSDNSSTEINRPSSSKAVISMVSYSEEKLPALKTQSSLSVHADSDTENGSEFEDAKSTPSLEPPDLSTVTSLTDNVSEKLSRAGQENWKSLFLADIFANSRLSDLNPRSFMASWHSAELPVHPSLFDDLEKKYSNLKTSTRLERKFVFDRIKSEILEFLEQFTDLKPTKVFPKWDISRIHETLRELVTRKYMKQSRDTKEKELQLPSLEDGIEVIGKEIEEMLTDELGSRASDKRNLVEKSLIALEKLD